MMIPPSLEWNPLSVNTTSMDILSLWYWQYFPARGRMVNALDPRSRGLRFDSRSAGVKAKALDKL